MSWGELFDRVDEYEVTCEDVQAALASRRADTTEPADESGEQS